MSEHLQHGARVQPRSGGTAGKVIPFEEAAAANPVAASDMRAPRLIWVHHDDGSVRGWITGELEAEA